jgi:hypothetical protein
MGESHVQPGVGVRPSAKSARSHLLNLLTLDYPRVRETPQRGSMRSPTGFS